MFREEEFRVESRLETFQVEITSRARERERERERRKIRGKFSKSL